MNGMRAFTDNANVVVRFMQTINCLFFQLRWLENNIRSSSNPQLIIVLILICLIGYLTFGCSQSDSQDSIDYFCGERGVSSLIVFALIVGIENASEIYALIMSIAAFGLEYWFFCVVVM